MKCFYCYFKLKGKGSSSSSSTSKRHRSSSAPQLQTRNPFSQQHSDNSSTADTNADADADGVHKSAGSTISARGITHLYQEKAPNLRVFSFSDLRLATNDFNTLLKIGEGGFGSVYKGRIKPLHLHLAGQPLPEPQAHPMFVAVKKLKEDGFQGHKQWLAEVQFLGVVKHPNLVKLIGYCALDGKTAIQRLLVYEYMPNKSLGDHLFRKAYPPLTWQTRLHILLGAAQGLAYLHEDLELQVIFRDFKTSNVLLDEDFQAKLSDFGLAREGPTAGQTHVSTAVVGTHGYAAPDYIETGHLTAKSDVWSFGVVLYEILTGRRSLERNHPQTQQNLLDWVKRFPADSKRFSSIMDRRLEDQYSLAAARNIAKLADSCLARSQKDRPKMSQVVERMKQIIQGAEDGNPSDGCTSKKSIEALESEEKVEETGPSQSAKRRLAHLVKLGEHTEIEDHGVRKFLIMQKAKVS